MKLKRYLGLYRILFFYHIKMLASYRSDFIVGSAYILISFFSVQFLLWAIFKRIDSLVGWSKDQILFVYGFQLIVTSVVWMLMNSIWILRDSLISGNFIKYKIKPINPTFFFFTETFGFQSLVNLVLGISVLYVVSDNVGMVWELENIALFLFFAVSAVVLLVGLLLAVSSIGFWNNNSAPLITLIVGICEISYYPLPIYNPLIIGLFSTILPIGYISFYPSASLLHINTSVNVYFMMPLVALGMLCIGLASWRKGVNYWESTGT